jgi:hypothetical protein
VSSRESVSIVTRTTSRQACDIQQGQSQHRQRIYRYASQIRCSSGTPRHDKRRASLQAQVVVRNPL